MHEVPPQLGAGLLHERKRVRKLHVTSYAPQVVHAPLTAKYAVRDRDDVDAPEHATPL